MVLGYLQPFDFLGSFSFIIVYKHEPCGAGSTADGGYGRCSDTRNSHGRLSDFGGSENVSHGYKGFHFSVLGKHPSQYLSRACNSRGSDRGKRIGILSLYRSGHDHIGQFFECGDGGTVRGNEKRVVVPAQIRFGQPVDSGMCTGDGFQHFSLEDARSCLSKPSFSGRGFVTDGTADRRSGTSIFQC